jgi:methionyl-tRNA formyltransferase
MKKTSKTTLTSGTKPRIIFFGNERLATGVATTVPTLQALIDSGYHIAAIVSNYEPGQSRKARPLEIQAIADTHSIPILLPKKLSEIADQLRAYDTVLAVLVAYGKIVPQSIIDIFPRGIVNIHPSLLPLHRGPTPIEGVILDGSHKTGTSIMSLAKAMDAGPVYAQSEVPLNGKETKQGLANQLLEVGKAMLLEVLPGIINGDIVALPQDEPRATYDQLINKTDGIINWQKDAIQLEREIRAFQGWPQSRTTISGKEVAITAAHTEPDEPHTQPGDVSIVPDTNIMMVATGKGSLCIEKLKPAGKNEMTAAEFLHGYGHLLQKKS